MEARPFMSTRIFGQTKQQLSDRAVFGAGQNVFSKDIGKFRIHSLAVWEATIMTDNRTIPLTEIPIGGKGGAFWNRLHGEREDICEALLKRSESASQAHQHHELLQARLRSIDDALD